MPLDVGIRIKGSRGGPADDRNGATHIAVTIRVSHAGIRGGTVGNAIPVRVLVALEPDIDVLAKRVTASGVQCDEVGGRAMPVAVVAQPNAISRVIVAEAGADKNAAVAKANPLEGGGGVTGQEVRDVGADHVPAGDVEATGDARPLRTVSEVRVGRHARGVPGLGPLELEGVVGARIEEGIQADGEGGVDARTVEALHVAPAVVAGALERVGLDLSVGSIRVERANDLSVPRETRAILREEARLRGVDDAHAEGAKGLVELPPDVGVGSEHARFAIGNGNVGGGKIGSVNPFPLDYAIGVSDPRIVCNERLAREERTRKCSRDGLPVARSLVCEGRADKNRVVAQDDFAKAANRGARGSPLPAGVEDGPG